MKDETLVYLALGGVALFLITKKRAVTVPVIPGGGFVTTQPVAAQPSQSLLANIFTGVATLLPKIINNQQAANNVSNGFNPDGTIPITSTGQDSINQLSPGSSGVISPVTIQLPVIDQGSTQDMADETGTNFDFSQLFG